MFKIIAIAVGVAFIAPLALSADATAASKEIEDICFDEAAKRSFNGRGGREQFIANCVADLTATPPGERRNYYKKKRRY